MDRRHQHGGSGPAGDRRGQSRAIGDPQWRTNNTDIICMACMLLGSRASFYALLCLRSFRVSNGIVFDFHSNATLVQPATQRLHSSLWRTLFRPGYASGSCLPMSIFRRQRVVLIELKGPDSSCGFEQAFRLGSHGPRGR